ncbi:hypothetical protein IWQ60_011058 [Tieghemiomyces parasiticus]|uniref:Uncharacterized protein n=1 Tax=Tieghemiomyces parasiticus TaxID=78921 RepID=A0A9W7ZP49_9FUNG|nr:hypothetical protein IWQ60_011058 [Tieghemiomyces parasiticus]
MAVAWAVKTSVLVPASISVARRVRPIDASGAQNRRHRPVGNAYPDNERGSSGVSLLDPLAGISDTSTAHSRPDSPTLGYPSLTKGNRLSALMQGLSVYADFVARQTGAPDRMGSDALTSQVAKDLAPHLNTELTTLVQQAVLGMGCDPSEHRHYRLDHSAVLPQYIDYLELTSDERIHFFPLLAAIGAGDVGFALKLYRLLYHSGDIWTLMVRQALSTVVSRSSAYLYPQRERQVTAAAATLREGILYLILRLLVHSSLDVSNFLAFVSECRAQHVDEFYSAALAVFSSVRPDMSTIMVRFVSKTDKLFYQAWQESFDQRHRLQNDLINLRPSQDSERYFTRLPVMIAVTVGPRSKGTIKYEGRCLRPKVPIIKSRTQVLGVKQQKAK